MASTAHPLTTATVDRSVTSSPFTNKILVAMSSLFIFSVSFVSWLLEAHREFGGHLDRLAMFFRLESTYYPTLRAFLRLEDPMISGPGGSVAFPWASMVPHSLALNLLGPMGFPLIEGLFHVGIFLIFIEVFVCFGLSRRAAILWSMAFECAIFFRAFLILPKILAALHADEKTVKGLGSYVTELFHPDSYNRVIRPNPSTAYLYLGLLATAHAWMAKRLLARHAVLVGLGVGLATGGYFIMGTYLGSLALLVVLVRWLCIPEERQHTVKMTVMALMATFVATIPFAIQYWVSATPEVAARFGVSPAIFAAVKLHADFWRALIIILTLQAAATFLKSRRFSHLPYIQLPSIRLNESRVLPFALLILLAWPLEQTWVPNLSGRSFHQGGAFSIFFNLEAFIWTTVIAIALQPVLQRLGTHVAYSRRQWMTAFLLALMVTSMIRTRALPGGHPRRHTWFFLEGLNEFKDDYLPRFMRLVDYLDEAPPYAEILTFDPMVKHFFSTFRGKKFYCPDPVSTRASDAEIEARLLSAWKMLGMRKDQLRNYLNGPGSLSYFNIQSLGHAKYSVSRRYSLEKLSHYETPVLDQIKWAFSAWSYIALGKDELDRLELAYDALSPESWKDRPLDVIVLIKNPYENPFKPPADFILAWESDAYRVFRRKT